MSHNESQRLKK